MRLHITRTLVWVVKVLRVHRTRENRDAVRSFSCFWEPLVSPANALVNGRPVYTRTRARNLVFLQIKRRSHAHTCAVRANVLRSLTAYVEAVNGRRLRPHNIVIINVTTWCVINLNLLMLIYTIGKRRCACVRAPYVIVFE
jgi:hypothetical protein